MQDPQPQDDLAAERLKKAMAAMDQAFLGEASQLEPEPQTMRYVRRQPVGKTTDL